MEARKRKVHSKSGTEGLIPQWIRPPMRAKNVKKMRYEARAAGISFL